MEFLKDLMNATLLPVAVAIAILLQVLKNLWTNAVKGELPRWADPVLAVAALIAAWFFVWRWAFYIPDETPPSLLSDVPTQIAILWIGTIFSHFILRQVYGSGRPVGTADELRATIARVDPIVVDKAGVTVTDTKPNAASVGGSSSGYVERSPGNGGTGPGAVAIMVGLALAFTLTAVGCGTAHAQRGADAVTEPDSSLVAFWRLSGYVDAKAATLERADLEQFTAFLPGAGLSYGLTADMSIVAGVEYDPASRAGWANAGGRLKTYQSTGPDPLSLYLGVDAVWPNDEARARLGYRRTRHTELSLRGAAPVARRADGSASFLAVASARWSPDERIVVDGLPHRRAPVYTIGLRYQAFGGRPTPTVTRER